MIDRDWAIKFAIEWIESFNSHNLERIFALYEDDFEMTSPYIIERMGVSNGKLKGKDQIRPYWQKSLDADPSLKLELIDIFVGVDSVVIYYKNVGRKMVCETFKFSDNGKVISGCSQHGKSLV